MNREINLAASFIVKLAIIGSKPVAVSYRQRQRLFKELTKLLEERVAVSLIVSNDLTFSEFKRNCVLQGHWYPEQPTRGEGYSSLHFHRSSGPDPLVLEAAKRANFPHDPLTWPLEMILWIDPDQVTARIGERGPIFPVTEDDVKWLYIRPQSTANSNKSHFVPRRPPLYQRVAARNTLQLYVPSVQFVRPIGIALRSNLERLNAMLSL